jgi:hypothetical protein
LKIETKYPYFLPFIFCFLLPSYQNNILDGRFLMVRILLRQAVHQWESFTWRTRLEIVAVGGLITVFLSGRLYNVFDIVLTAERFTEFTLTLFSSQVIIFLLALSGPFIIAYLVPRQRSLRIFYPLPLRKADTIALVMHYVLKYQLLFVLLLIPLLFATVLYSGLPYLCLAMIKFTLFGTGIILLQIILLIKLKKVQRFVGISTIVNLLYLAVWSVFIIYFERVWMIDLMVAFLLYFSALIIYKKSSPADLEKIYPPVTKPFARVKKILLPTPDRNFLIHKPLFFMFYKEILSVWRNPRYRRLKGFTLILFVAGFIFLKVYVNEYVEMWMLIWAAIIIWIHYSSGFNDKYVQPDPQWYIKTLPVKFYQVWISKFLAEFTYLFVILTLFFTALLYSSLTWYQIFNLMTVLILFSVFVLLTMIIFKLMFYDDPRLAGYAFHFTILFITIMSLNDRLVGPIVGILLVVFYLYKSYRYFKT